MRALFIKFTVFLCFGLSSVVKGAELTVSYDEDSITITCRAGNNISHIVSYVSISVERVLASTTHTAQSVTMATAKPTRSDGQARVFHSALTRRSTVTGKADNRDKQGSFVRVVLNNLTCSDAGQYLCRISYLTGRLQTRISTESIIIKKQMLDSFTRTRCTAENWTVNTGALTLGIELSLLCIIALAVVVLCFASRRSKKTETRAPSEPSPELDEFPRNRVRLRNLIWEGRFGKLLKAEALDILGLGKWDEVAVKMVKESATSTEKEHLHSELRIMRKVSKHIHVVGFLGCCTVEEPTLVIMEYVPGGDLLTYLRKYRPESRSGEEEINGLTPKDLLVFAFQTARGLQHLENCKVVHGYVAARSVLLDKHKVCKISDFSRARDLEGADVFDRAPKGPLPIRWMSPECLKDKSFSHKSDVWAYGVLLWEIVTLGASPYPGMSVKDVITFVLDKKTQNSPQHCNDAISKMMQECWQFDVIDRPSFDDVIKTLDQALEDAADYIRLENMDYSFYSIVEGQFVDEEVLC